MCKLFVSLSLMAFLAPSLAGAAVRWKGDFESGNLSQWTGTQMVSADRIAVVESPIRSGRYAARVLVKQGDDPINSSGNRNELVNSQYQPEGSESYYRWSTMFDQTFPSAKTWQLFAQWHQIEDSGGSPPIQFMVFGEEVQLTLSTSENLVWKAPLVRGVWHDFILHVKFSDDAAVGFIEVWYDGNRVLPKTFGITRANDYLKIGLYRSDTVVPDGIVYHDGMVQGDTLDDVLPRAPPAPPAPQAPASVPVPSVPPVAPDLPVAPVAPTDPSAAPPALPLPSPGLFTDAGETALSVSAPSPGDPESGAASIRDVSQSFGEGGCSATDGARSWMAVLGALWGLVASRRRRADRIESNHETSGKRESCG